MPVAAWNAIGYVLLAAGFLVFVAAFIPRTGRRPRCPKCSYDFAGIRLDPIPTCPECGTTARSKRQILRSRPSHKLMALGIGIALLCNIPYATPRVREVGWVGAIPTTALVLWYPYFTTDRGQRLQAAEGPVEEEFVRRCVDGYTSGEFQPGPFMSRIMGLRVELAFRWADRWGASDAELDAIRHFKRDIPFESLADDESIDSWIASVESVAGRRLRIDEKRYRTLGLDPAAMRNVLPGSPIRQADFSFLVHSTTGGIDRSALVYPMASRGEVVATPAPQSYACVTSLKPITGMTIWETEEFLDKFSRPFPMFLLMEGAGVRTSSFVSGNTLLLYGSEASLAYSQILHSLASAATPSPWAPLWPVDPSAARRTFEILESTAVPEEVSSFTVSAAIKAIARKTGLTVVDRSDANGARPLLFSSVGATPPRTTTELLDFIASRLGGVSNWNIELDGSIEIETTASSSDGIAVIYDAPTLMTGKRPMDAWRTVVSLVPGCGVDSEMVPIGSRLAIRTSVVNHFRLERIVRARLRETGTREMPSAAQPGR